jgi:multiple sugar transport system ATP-binding protein
VGVSGRGPDEDGPTRGRNAEAEVGFEGVTKVFRDGTVALEDVDLTVPGGSLFVVVGPSGSGKTTLLRVVAGLEQPTSGTLTIDGEDVTEASPKERDVAMVFQSYALYPHLTGFENIAFGLRSRRVAGDEVARRVQETARMLGIEQVLAKRPRSMSGGQRQRVALGRAIVREPRVFLMDEPLSDVDAKLRDQMRSELARIQRTLGVTTIYVTHDQAEALQLGELVAVMDRGVVRQVGTPRELYDRPDDVFVAAFLGTPRMNLAEATVERDGEGALARFGGHRLRLADAEGLAAERQVIVGIRPEHLRPARPGDDPRSVLTARVERHEGLGPHGTIRFPVDAPLLMETDPRDAVAPEGWAAERANTFAARVETDEDWTGREVQLHAAPERVHLFDPATELAIR